MNIRDTKARFSLARRVYRAFIPAPKTKARDKRVDDPQYNAIILRTDDGLPVPPIEMRDKVRKSAILAEDFLLEGKEAYQSINLILAENGVRVGADSAVYDFGVGCGRLARYFLTQPLGTFYGSDVDTSLVGWCATHLNGPSIGTTRFFTNGYLPPIDLPSESIDFLYAISVITHMNEEAQLQWLEELPRVVKPGGHILLSYLDVSRKAPGRHNASGIYVTERIDREFKRHWLGENGAPTVYYDTHNSADYLASRLRKSCEFVAQVDRAIRNHQNVVLMRKR